jgi:hypothetical protein
VRRKTAAARAHHARLPHFFREIHFIKLSDSFK